jgi:hypothetical protein
VTYEVIGKCKEIEDLIIGKGEALKSRKPRNGQEFKMGFLVLL